MAEDQSPRAVALPVLQAATGGRLSADAWIFARPGRGRAASLTATAPVYGASQAGAVIRYRLGGGDHRAPYAYVRGTLALAGPARDTELAAGLGVRPIARLPVRVLGEVRLSNPGGGVSRLRPAVAAVSELAPVSLPLGAQSEIYGQAGYVGGADASPFFDLQAVTDRRIAVVPGGRELRAGAGVWAGGQRGAARLDLGPRVSLRLPLGKAGARLALDWRVRVAGNAAPASGGALTLSAGF